MAEYHPNRIDDEEFINQRAERAAETFESFSKAGASVEESMYETRKVLFEGLHFSPYMFVREIIENEFPNVETDDEIDEFALIMVEHYKHIINAEERHDNFSETEEYKVLYNTMKETINQHLIRNGIQ